MTIAFAQPILIAIVFGLVVSAVEGLIAGAFLVRPFLARAWVYACFCYVVLFGAIKL